MSFEFTLTDKALMLRAARILKEDALALEREYGPVWVATPEGQEGKRVYDRLLRDVRDLKALVKRLEVLHPPVPSPKAPVFVEGPGGEVNP